MGVKPLHGAAQQDEQLSVIISFGKRSLDFAVSHPGHPRHRVGINRMADSQFILQGKGMDYGQKLPEIIGATLQGSIRKSSRPDISSTPRYSTYPGFFEHAASTAHALRSTSGLSK